MASESKGIKAFFSKIWNFLKSLFKKSDIEEIVSNNPLALADIINWIKANSPKSFEKAVILKNSKTNMISKQYENCKYHIYVCFWDKDKVAKGTKSVLYHANELDKTLESNFGDKDMIVITE